MNELLWSEAKEEWTELNYAQDPHADYSFDDIVLFKKPDEDKYALFFDSGCSCPSPFEDNPRGDVYTKAQLLHVVGNWNGDRTEKETKDWVLENIKP